MIVLADSVWHVISAFFVFCLSGIFYCALARFFLVQYSRALLLYLYHSSMSLAYMSFSLVSVADSTKYYADSLSAVSIGVGTQFVNWFVSLFSRYLSLSYLGVFLVFNLLGAVGLLAFYAALKKQALLKSAGIKWIVLFVVLLPSVSFWSSAIGKDSISFMAVGLSLWAALDIGRRKLLMSFAILIMFSVRPHMAGMMVVALTAGVFFDSRAGIRLRVFVGATSLFLAFLLIPFAMHYAGLDSVLNLMNYVELRQGYNQEGGGGVDIASMSFPMQLFTYGFRPLPFEAHSVMALLASLDNVILMFVCFLGVYGWFFHGNRSSTNGNAVFMVVYVCLAWALLAVTTANLGIAVRQKWMFMPFVVFLAISCIDRLPFRFSQKHSPAI